ncbi:hypothetical protein COV42_02870 [Candidatus Campbellbacteria bacterium CG11_big_fil_rev_8_21_14_0_20_44_21]|nr:MAG: hypothetical protein COV42_02870 [Candidatus Campbellbacteria bacterium CG11_big_fil_rev_8_21_14_0_20_44_21]
MNKLENLFNEVRKISEGHKEFKLPDFIEYLNILVNYNILIKMKEGVSLFDSVHLMTAHKSKGLEFDYVYIIGLNDGHWGNRKNIRHFHLPNVDKDFLKDKNEDERRLFYVALTRAKKEVILTYARENFDKDYKIASQFVEEIDKKFLEKKETAELEKLLSRSGLNKYSAKKNKPLSIKDRKYLKNLFLEQGFSVTAFNNYLEDPWKYFFESLVRLPSMRSSSQEYGSAMHEALSLKNFTKAKMLKVFRDSLSRKALNDGDYKKYLERGRLALEGYFKARSASLRQEGLRELDIAGVFTEVEHRNKKIKILLKGKIDKIEFLSDGKIRVIDYKTGRWKSRNEMEGGTKNSDGNYKRQLVFYKLLLKKMMQNKKLHSGILPNAGMDSIEGVIDFIEPDDKGAYREREIFQISGKEVDELENEIKKTAKDILDFKFWRKNPASKSKYLALVEILKQK